MDCLRWWWSFCWLLAAAGAIRSLSSPDKGCGIPENIRRLEIENSYAKNGIISNSCYFPAMDELWWWWWIFRYWRIHPQRILVRNRIRMAA
jgi:hypothetical protein